MNAFDAFNRTLERAQSLVDVHCVSFPKGRPPKGGEPDDLLRAVVVFAVSAVDSYIHDKIIENVVRIVVYCGKRGSGFPGHLIDVMKSAITTEKALTLIYRKRPDQEVQKIMRQHLSERTFQDPGKIEAAMRYLGLSDLWEPVRVRLRLSSKDRAKKFIQSYVNRRHHIVHEGDIYKSKKYRHQLRPITRPYARNCVRDVKKFVKVLNDVIDQHLQNHYQ